MGKGYVLVDVPADRFAERSRREGRLVWGDMPEGMVIRGLKDMTGQVPQILIVTRQASFKEQAQFGHERMPLLEAPLFSAERIPEEPFEETSDSLQMELF